MRIIAATTLRFSPEYGLDTVLRGLWIADSREVELSPMDTFCLPLPHPQTRHEAIIDVLGRHELQPIAFTIGRWDLDGQDCFFDYTENSDARDVLMRAAYQHIVSLDFEHRMPDTSHIMSKFEDGISAFTRGD